MLYLDVGITASIVVTLQEKASNKVDPFYTWKITDADTNISYVFTADDISTKPWYYNEFALIVNTGATVGATMGVLPCPTGVYYYNVFESATPYNLDLNNVGSLVEQGILNITTEYPAYQSYTASNSKPVMTYKKIKKDAL